MGAFGLCGKIVATPGNGDALAEHLLEAAAVLEDFDGCRLYLVNQSTDEADTVWVIEMWDDVASHRASLELEAVRDVIARARPLIGNMAEGVQLTPLGGKGLSLPAG